MSTHVYTISTATLNGAVATAKLTNEIRSDATITKALLSVSDDGADTLTIEFKEALTAGMITALDALVAAHDGNPGLDDAQKVKFVGAANDEASLVDDSGTFRIPVDVKGDATIVGPQGPQGDTGPQGPQGDPGPVSTFGTEYTYVESLSQSSTTSTTFQTKLTMTTASLPAGTYRLNWGYGWSLANTGDDFEGRVRLDSVEIMLHKQEPKDPGTDQCHVVSGIIPNLALSGVHVIDIQFRTDDAGETAWIRDARLELWRVS